MSVVASDRSFEQHRELMTKFVWGADTEFVARVRQSSDKRFFVRADDAVHFGQFSGRPRAALWKGHPRMRSVFHVRRVQQPVPWR